jgi:prepilin-type N-terminal cleavage/methylation domain-containing protein
MENLLNRATRRRHSGQTGFTLIELLVVIAVLAILAAIVVFNVTGVTDKGKTSACKTDLHSVQTASDAYYNQVGSYPNAFVGQLVPGYIHQAPTDLGTITWGSVANNGTVTSDQC